MDVLVKMTVIGDDAEFEAATMLRHIADAIEADFLGGPIPPCGSTDTISGNWGVSNS